MKKRWLGLITLAILLFPKVALADFGPKTSLDIYVENAPTGSYYYLDLLVTDTENMDAEYNPEGYDETLYRMLWDYNEDGYRAKMVHQDMWVAGVRGDLTGGSHRDFVQAPSTFKIIIASSDGVRVSDVYRRIKFSDTIRIDYETMQITADGNSVLEDWLLQFLQTFSATILIEGVILLLFGFKLKKNWKPFLLVNLITQVILIVSMGVVMLFWGMFAYVLLFGLMEAAIIIAESIAYKKLLYREKPEGRVAYAVTANVISLLVSFIVIAYTTLT